MNPWQLYDDLINGIPENLRVNACTSGHVWTTVTTDEGGIGMAMTIPISSMPRTYLGRIAGSSLRQIAQLSTSWNFVEAAIGVAAIGAYYNHPARVRFCGVEHPGSSNGQGDAFELYREDVKGKKVAVVGHFPVLEQKLGPICDMTIIERDPQWGDLPDSACEFVLDKQDFVLITGSTLVNKTLPRLLALSSSAKVILIGPSTVMSAVLFDHGVYGLSGLILEEAPDKCELLIREGQSQVLFEAGVMVDRIRTLP